MDFLDRLASGFLWYVVSVNGIFCLLMVCDLVRGRAVELPRIVVCGLFGFIVPPIVLLHVVLTMCSRRRYGISPAEE